MRVILALCLILSLAVMASGLALLALAAVVAR